MFAGPAATVRDGAEFGRRLALCVACQGSRIDHWKQKTFAYTAGARVTAFQIDRCGDCGTGFLNPPPSPDYLNSIYAYSGHGLTEPVSAESVLAAEAVFPNSTVDADRLVAVGASLDRSGSGQALDVGSGYGFVTRAMRASGYRTVSINPGAYENLVFEGLNGDLPLVMMFDEYVHVGPKFGLVVLSQVLEHIVEPARTVARIHDLLEPGGVFACAVPNFGSAAVAVLGIRDNACLWVPEHVNYFTLTGLCALLTRSGFEIVSSNNITRVPYDALSRRVPWLPASPAKAAVKYGQKPIAAVLDRVGRGTFLNVYARKIARP
jgi:SAM-dependent methyltransferase